MSGKGWPKENGQKEWRQNGTMKFPPYTLPHFGFWENLGGQNRAIYEWWMHVKTAKLGRYSIHSHFSLNVTNTWQLQKKVFLKTSRPCHQEPLRQALHLASQHPSYKATLIFSGSSTLHLSLVRVGIWRSCLIQRSSCIYPWKMLVLGEMTGKEHSCQR